jgi:hypothetical protein
MSRNAISTPLAPRVSKPIVPLKRTKVADFPAPRTLSPDCSSTDLVLKVPELSLKTVPLGRDAATAASDCEGLTVIAAADAGVALPITEAAANIVRRTANRVAVATRVSLGNAEQCMG